MATIDRRVIIVSGDEEVAAALRRMAATGTSPIGTALHAGALVIEADAKRRAPVLTGNLRRSIHTERVSDEHVTVGTDVEYAPYQEFGTSRMAARPYLRPAADENEEAILAAVERVIDAAIANLGALG